MTLNPIPPQAYTRETLTKAYAWLRTQSDSVKEMATSADSLVSLYLKAQRDGEGSLERPSVQSFKNELKNLAGMMGEFEEAAPLQHTRSAPAPLPQTPNYQPPAQSVAPPQQNQLYVQNNSSANQVYYGNPSQNQPPQASYQAPFQGVAGDLRSNLDGKSWAMIQEVKVQFNLSSETEALRLLISLGHSKAKAILS